MTKIKKLSAVFVFAFAGLATFGSVGGSTEATSVPETTTQLCRGCCPITICGFNGPSFDGTTETEEPTCNQQNRE